MDSRVNPEAPQNPTHVAIRRDDYRPPDWLIPDIALDFALDPERTVVRSTLSVVRNGDHNRPLRLDGDELDPVSVTVNGEAASWTMDGPTLIIEISDDEATVETEVRIAPAANSKLMGLYASGGLLCTQCEAEGFRRITFFPDRPDVLSRYSVRMEADRTRFPILLANGNPVASGEGEGNRHWARWDDPFPKPCYLFALVAGDLMPNRDSFTTMSGRNIDLAIWVREADLAKTGHAMHALKDSMRWDEEVYGREYDLDQFNIVAVSDFNMGAMENKGLNIFNTAYVLADPDTATDADFDNVARVVAHEYFHNWSGNRVTCRDWFQLSLKEGFTVYRDQCFSADMGSPAVKRIDDVRLLRTVQFPEDSGPLAHPVRPDSYIEISNFYTATIYNKGAELIRMMATIIGPEKFRAGTDLYFDRHDGEAATCEDFVTALEEASGIDLTQFRRWYSQAGTPRIRARLDHDRNAGSAVLHLEQQIPPTPGQVDKRPMPIPLKTSLIGADSGDAMGEERLILLDSAQQSIQFDGIAEEPLLSINRGFSAPVVVDAERRPGELERLAQSDDDPFARYEAMQELMQRSLVAGARGREADVEPIVEAVRATLSSNALDPAFKAEAILLPSEALIAERLEQVDPDLVHQSRERVRHAIGGRLGELLEMAQAAPGAEGSDLSPHAKGVRRLRSIALSYLMAADPDGYAGLAKRQFDGADNMTDRQGALAALTSTDTRERAEALEQFYSRFEGDPLVIDKWFAMQAIAQRDATIDDVATLSRHPAFTLENPNRLRSLASSFSMNHWVFHHASGRGFELLTDMILAADRINPQIAARLVPPLGRWRRFEPKRAALMRQALERIAGNDGLSRDVYEQASKSLG